MNAANDVISSYRSLDICKFVLQFYRRLDARTTSKDNEQKCKTALTNHDVMISIVKIIVLS